MNEMYDTVEKVLGGEEITDKEKTSFDNFVGFASSTAEEFFGDEDEDERELNEKMAEELMKHKEA